MKLLKLSFAIVTLFTLAACGTTSGIQSDDTAEASFSVKSYDSVVIGEFKGNSDNVKFKGKTEEIKTNKKTAYEEQASNLGAEFAQILATELRSSGTFASVSVGQEESAESAILIEGIITRFKEGNAAARLLIGFGAGSSNFDAEVYIKDLQTGEQIGTVNVDKNSWALGGAVALTQDVRSHMVSAAKKIAADLQKAKLK